MISYAIAAAVIVAALQAASAPPARTQFSKCLDREMKKGLGAKLAPEAFQQSLAAACTSEKTAFTDYVVQSEMKMGAKRADAQSSAAMQVKDYLDVAVEDYRAYHEAGDMPPD